MKNDLCALITLPAAVEAIRHKALTIAFPAEHVARFATHKYPAPAAPRLRSTAPSTGSRDCGGCSESESRSGVQSTPTSYAINAYISNKQANKHTQTYQN